MHLESKLRSREKLGNLRELTIQKKLIDFSSNDTLGLAKSSLLAAAVRQEFRHCSTSLNGLGSTGSRLLTGNTRYAQDLENAIALFHGYETGLLFSCGYMANIGLLSAIAGPDDTIFFDTKVHASIHDGILLSRAKAFSFRHNDVEHLEKRLKNCSIFGDRWICIESLYSTNGLKAPLFSICQLAKKYDAKVIVDEAHAIGVYGPDGRGLVTEENLVSEVFAQVNTFGKALGTYGAIVLGSIALKQTLVNFATSCIYTTALPFHSLAAIKCSYDFFPHLETKRKHLQKLIQIFQNHHINSSSTHIQSIRFKGNETVKQASNKLLAQGYDVRPLMSPTVQRGEEILRICLHAFNSENELISLIDAIRTIEECLLCKK